MTCPACISAVRTPRASYGEAGCLSCKARMLAAIGGHLESRATGKRTERYLETLKALFGDEWKAGAEEVKRWGTQVNQSNEPPRERVGTKK